MSEEVRLTAYGARLAITVDEPSLLDAVWRRLPPRWTPLGEGPVDARFTLVAPAGAGGAFHVRAGDELIAARPTLDEALIELQSVLHGAVACQARGAVFVHAGVVTSGGRAIVVPGRSLSGKTSLVAALLRAGATYYSDEYAVLDDAGLVHPYPKPLSIRRPGRPRRHVSPDASGYPIGQAGCPVGLVVATTYGAGATWRPMRLSPADMALELLNNTIRVREQPAYALAVVRAAIRAETSGVRSPRGDADTIAPRLVAMLSNPVH